VTMTEIRSGTLALLHPFILQCPAPL